MTLLPSSPVKLNRDHIRDGFDSGAKELDDWLHRYALQNLRANSAITYVSCRENLVVGYYAITVGAISKQTAPTVMQKSAPREIPCIVLARLAVDMNHQKQGVGIGLLTDALKRSALISESVGAMAVLIHARDPAARKFYESQVDFHQSPVDELQLMIPMKAIREWFSVEG